MTIINRSAIEHWSAFFGNPVKWPSDWAYTVDGKPVTYTDIREERKREQSAHLSRILAPRNAVRRAAQVWVFFVPGWLYGGWHLYVRTLQDEKWLWEGDPLAMSIMRQFPCGLLPLPECFYEWKKAFARKYARPGKRRQGIANGWINVERGHFGDEFFATIK